MSNLVGLRPAAKLLTPEGWVSNGYMEQDTLDAVMAWHTAAMLAMLERIEKANCPDLPFGAPNGAYEGYYSDEVAAEIISIRNQLTTGGKI